MATVEFRYDPKNTAWFTANAAMVLKAGEPAYHDTTGLFKLGDGVTALSALSFLPTVSSSSATIQQVLTTGNVATTTIETTGFIKTGGLSTEFLKADGTVDSSTYITSSALSPYLTSATAALTYQPIGSYLTTISGLNISLLNNDSGYITSVGTAATSLTTNNSSGAATLIANVLNVPNYTLAGLGGTTLAAVNAQNLSVFAATTSSQLAGVISDETGTGSLVFGTSPTFTTSVTINGALVQNTYSTIGSNGYGGYFAATTGATNNYAAGFNGRVSQEGLGSSTFFGFMCGVKDDLTANLNTGFGASALLTNIVGTKNCAFGYFALRLTTGSFNVGFGTETLYSNTTGAQNVAIGNNALFSNQTATGNTAVGDLSLFQTTGASNTGVGKNTLYDHTSGTFNTAIGWNTGRGITTGTRNTIIGAQVIGLTSTLSNNVIIADGAGNKVLWFDAANALISNLKIDTTTGIKIATSTTQKISFWNATPIVQPTTAVAAAAFVANTSLIANDTATFDGYTIGQIVKALRNAGLLA